MNGIIKQIQEDGFTTTDIGFMIIPIYFQDMLRLIVLKIPKLPKKHGVIPAAGRNLGQLLRWTCKRQKLSEHFVREGRDAGTVC